MPLFKLHGTHVIHHKNTTNMAPKRLNPPKEVIIPMSMHIGAPATPIVSVGSRVLVGEKIAEATSFVSSPIHASISGKVKKIDEMLTVNGNKVQTIIIESDGLMEKSPQITPPTVTNYKEFVDAVKESGVVGLGGAGFPTAVKLNVKDLAQIEEVIVNAAECEPYITSDTRTMIDDIEYVKKGAKLLENYLGVKKIIFGIEDNKQEAINNLKMICQGDDALKVKVLKSKYPQGGEKVLIYNTVGKVVPEGGLPLNVGVIVINITTLALIAKYIEAGMPLVEKVITVDGSSVVNPMNVIVPIGTKMSYVFDSCGGFKEKPYKILSGGPMMGVASYSLDSPILKNTNAILAFNEKDSHMNEPSPCIKCGRCMNHCPFHLNPVAISKALELENDEELEKLKVNICMECGVCSYVCPAKRPLVQNNKIAKTKLRTYLNKKKETKGN